MNVAEQTNESFIQFQFSMLLHTCNTHIEFSIVRIQRERESKTQRMVHINENTKYHGRTLAY